MIPFVTAEEIEKVLSYPRLIAKLKEAFTQNYTTPERLKYQYRGAISDIENTLLLMPSWQNNKDLGVKLVTVTPDNSNRSLPAVQGVYILFDIVTGKPSIIIDAKRLTTKRTAATSALASKFLSRKNSKVLLMVGTGALCKELINAHCSVRPIEKVLLWGRNFEKSQIIASSFPKLDVIPIENIETGLNEADIISCATLSSNPLLFGRYLKNGQHVDLVGSYLPHSREADDEVIQKASVYIDAQHSKRESGELFIPLSEGILSESDILNDLVGLCSNDTFQRRSNEEITLFKSTGHAMEDLAAAQLIKEMITNNG
jgi:ornithine cyclodeaminase